MWVFFHVSGPKVRQLAAQVNPRLPVETLERRIWETDGEGELSARPGLLLRALGADLDGRAKVFIARLASRPSRGAATGAVTTRLNRRWARATLGCSVAMLLLSGCGKPAMHIPDGLIKGAIDRAQQDGRATAEIRIPFEPPEDLSLPLDALERNSGVVVKPTGRSVVSVQPYVLYTWHVLKVEHAISLKPPNRGACGLTRPATAAAGEGEAALPLVQGSAASNGVTVRVKGRDEAIHLERGATYVPLVENCPERSFSMRLGPSAVIRVDADGRLRPSDGGRAAFSSELAGMTLERLRQLTGNK